MSLKIDRATVDDAAAVARIYEPYVIDAAASFELTPPAVDEMANRIESSNRSHSWLVAREGSAIVGYAYGTTARTRPAYRFTTEVSVYLDQNQRGRGIGRMLMSELLEILTSLGYVTAIAGVTLPNDASVRLFESLGFRPVGVYHHIGFKFGRWHDVGWWERMLPPTLPPTPTEIPVDV